MTNREWLNYLSNEDFVSWLLDSEIFLDTLMVNDTATFKFVEPSPKLETLRYMATNTKLYLIEWLDKERIIK